MRLIDADLITGSNELATKVVTRNLVPYIKVDDLIEFIDNLPTAYDVEKVVAELRERLKAYEDAEEQGLLLRLPFEIGIPIYKIVYSSKINDGFVYERTMSLKYYADDIKAFEKGLVYSDKEEAEKKLASMQKGE